MPPHLLPPPPRRREGSGQVRTLLVGRVGSRPMVLLPPPPRPPRRPPRGPPATGASAASAPGAGASAARAQPHRARCARAHTRVRGGVPSRGPWSAASAGRRLHPRRLAAAPSAAAICQAAAPSAGALWSLCQAAAPSAAAAASQAVAAAHMSSSRGVAECRRGARWLRLRLGPEGGGGRRAVLRLWASWAVLGHLDAILRRPSWVHLGAPEHRRTMGAAGGKKMGRGGRRKNN